MRMTRMLSLVALIGVVLLFAADGHFQPGIAVAMLLAFLIGLVEPSSAK